MPLLDKLTGTKIKVDPEKIYVAFTGAVTPAGAFGRGERARGSDPRVNAYPKFWFEEGVSDREEQDLWVERFGLAMR